MLINHSSRIRHAFIGVAASLGLLMIFGSLGLARASFSAEGFYADVPSELRVDPASNRLEEHGLLRIESAEDEARPASSQRGQSVAHRTHDLIKFLEDDFLSHGVAPATLRSYELIKFLEDNVDLGGTKPVSHFDEVLMTPMDPNW